MRAFSGNGQGREMEHSGEKRRSASWLNLCFFALFHGRLIGAEGQKRPFLRIGGLDFCTKFRILDICLGDRSDFQRKTNNMSPGDPDRL